MSEQREPYQAPSRRGGNHSASHSDLLSACADYLRWQGGHTLRILGGVGTRKGSPDLVAVLAGRFIAVDAKTGSAVLSDHQRIERSAYERAGALFIVVHRPEDLEDALVAAGLVTACIQRGGER